MGNDAGVTEGWTSLEQLAAVVRNAVTQEEKLDRDLQARVTALRKRRDASVDQIRRRLAGEGEGESANLTAIRAHLEGRLTRRREWILRSHKSSQRTAAVRAEEEEGRRKYRLQTEGMQARKSWESARKQTEERHEAFIKAMEAEEKILVQAEADAFEVLSGFKSLRRLLSDPALAETPPVDADEDGLARDNRDQVPAIKKAIRTLRWKPLPLLFRFTPAWVILLPCSGLLVPVATHLGIPAFGWPQALGVTLGGWILLAVLHLAGKSLHAAESERLARNLQRARRWHDTAVERSVSRHAQDLRIAEEEFNARRERIELGWGDAASTGMGLRELFLRKVDNKLDRIRTANELQFDVRMRMAEAALTEKVAGLTAAADDEIALLQRQCAEAEQRFSTERADQIALLRAEFSSRLPGIFQELKQAQEQDARLFPPWTDPVWASWTLPASPAEAVTFGRCDVDLSRLAGGLPKDPTLALPGPSRFTWPMFLRYPGAGSLLIEAPAAGRDTAIATLNAVLLRLLCGSPAGRISLTLVDPVGLGQNFAGAMHLADHAEHMIQGRIWTQPEQIDRRLADLNEHMEKVIQMYLRNEYATIADYNRQAGSIAEKQHLLVIADFPAGFTDAAARKLLSIATSGARCGVHTLIHWDERQPVPPDFPVDELRRNSVCVSCDGRDASFRGRAMPGADLHLDPPPPAALAIQLIHRIGQANKDSNRVEVPFDHITPADKDIWSLESTEELRVSMGRTGATKQQYLSLGKGTRQHALVAGKTGSGKSTLFHVLITNLSMWYSPEQVEFYLIDFKKGVEFKTYATHRLPHVKVVAIESDREFGLSVLQKLDEELRRRGDLFRRLGVQDLPGYKRSGAREPMPRTLLLIDEFQEFFVEDDKVSQGASLLLDRIVRQGRAFGIHVILGSQTLGGAYTVARATLGQMVVRIALQCNEADAYLIMDEGNAAPRLLSRPGEGIYNDAAGASEGNSPFQVVWIPDSVRDAALEKVRLKAEASGVRYPGPFVYEGDAAAEIAENPELARLLEAPSLPAAAPAAGPRMWLGAPNSIKGPTEMVFRRQGGKNLLIVGQREESILSILTTGMLALAAQYPRGEARFVLLDGTSPGTTERDYLDRVVSLIPHEVVLSRDGDLAVILQGLVDEMKVRTETGTQEGRATFLVINGLQRYKKLRSEDEFAFSADDNGSTAAPAASFAKLLPEGPAAGFHVIAACDGYNNVNRFLNRKALAEFEMRVLFQMSANDSASLIDSPKASTLGLHRAVYYNDQEGSMEVFRPYALPASAWLDHAGRELARISSAKAPASG